MQIVTTQPLTDEAKESALSFRPEVVHAFHAFKSGIVALELARQVSAPLVVTITGTDVHSDLHHPNRRELVLGVLKSASAITTFSPEIANELVSADASFSRKVFVIPQGVWFPNQEAWDVREHLGISNDVPLLLLPANIRKVKRPRLAFEGVSLLRKLGFDAHILFVGEVLEQEEWEQLNDVMKNCQWAHYLGPVPMERMASVYLAAEIVLNTSEHEGGMANALLEGMWLKRPVLVSKVAGNVSLVRHEETGLLFSDAKELANQAARLLTDAGLRERLVQNAYEWVLKNCNPIKEAQSYLRVYHLSMKL